MRRSLGDQIPWWVWPPILFLAIVIAGLASPYARADSVDDVVARFGVEVCVVLDEYPTVPGLVGVMQGVEDSTGLSARESGEAVALSVLYICPIHRPVLDAFAQQYGSGVQV